MKQGQSAQLQMTNAAIKNFQIVDRGYLAISHFHFPTMLILCSLSQVNYWPTSAYYPGLVIATELAYDRQFYPCHFTERVEFCVVLMSLVL